MRAIAAYGLDASLTATRHDVAAAQSVGAHDRETPRPRPVQHRNARLR
jgi:hypothetical protein